ncbi:DUF4855 domain-containing protein [Alistipes sp.]|uniref:DUF4855 domain-containing protein n=1 Tax=Alistipes sp. TaxID=1872444 RepID=UPI0025B892F9|nr:DUF4855 domain-containing protein [Alistipes sp.]
MIRSIHRYLLSALLVLFASGGCTEAGSDNDSGHPSLHLQLKRIDARSVTLQATSRRATQIRYICKTTGVLSSESVQSVMEHGEMLPADPELVIEGLEAETFYTLFAVACDQAGRCSTLQHIQFTTGEPASSMYPWESERDGLPTFTDLVLCYGGSHHRIPFRWDKERFAPMVSYTDPDGKEQWLFDAFLFIEFQDTPGSDNRNYAYMTGLLRENGFSAGKRQWQELIDYWFQGSSGFEALDQAIAEAAQRLGTPPSKRKVVMTLPDPILHRVFDKKGNGSGDPASTVYWGELEGRTQDFSNSEHRVAACKWYINEVRRRFDQGKFRNIELAGFYILSEEIATPDEGWDYELKQTDKVIPHVAAYLHSLNESLSWIPYNRAAGYTKWKEMGVDYAYMQPNYFWKPELSLERFFADIRQHGLNMEFELDENVFNGKADCEAYRKRFRQYLSEARKQGIYGSRPLSYYQGTNAFYDLSRSQSPEEQALYHEFCQFVINNPMRKN